MESVLAAVSNAHPAFLSLDKEVALHFKVEREKYTGNYHIGSVRVIIERIEDEE